MRIRHDRADDLESIERIRRAAFAGPVEARLVARLRADGDAMLSLVAELGRLWGMSCSPGLPRRSPPWPSPRSR